MDNSNNTIQETTDYGQFKFLNNNRELSKPHKAAIKKAIEEVGNLTKVTPILVNENMEIIDGQHRFSVCKDLGLPVYYSVVSGIGIKEARHMNILQRNWNVLDFAKSYADSGNPNYQKYLRLREDYKFSHSVTLAALYGPASKGNRSLGLATFRKGNMEITDEMYAKAQKRLDILQEIGEHTGLATSGKVFAYAVFKIADSDNYDHDRMIVKISERAHTLEKYALLSDQLRQLEEVYNFSSQKPVRLF